MHVTIPVTGVPSHYYFALNAKTGEPFREDDHVIVYADKDKAMAAFNSTGPAFVLIGMGDEKWALFQQSEKYIVKG